MSSIATGDIVFSIDPRTTHQCLGIRVACFVVVSGSVAQRVCKDNRMASHGSGRCTLKLERCLAVPRWVRTAVNHAQAEIRGGCLGRQGWRHRNLCTHSPCRDSKPFLANAGV